jgi:hypothetical protein
MGDPSKNESFMAVVEILEKMGGAKTILRFHQIH